MSWRVVQAFDLAAALSDVAKGLKKKLQDIIRAAAIGEIQSIAQIHTQTIMSTFPLPFHQVVLPGYHIRRLPIPIPPHRSLQMLMVGDRPPTPERAHSCSEVALETTFPFFVGGTMLHSRYL